MLRVVKVAAGLALLPVGVALLVLPGPGILVIASGLLLLGSEFRWADKARTRLLRRTRRAPR